MRTLLELFSRQSQRHNSVQAVFIVVLLTFFTACDELPQEPSRLSGRTLATLIAPLPDYAISEVQDSTEGTLDDRSPVYFRVRVANLGEGAGMPTSVAMFVNGQFERDVPISELSGGQDTTVTFTWHPSAGLHEVLFGVDRPPLDTTFVHETNESNNTALRTLSVPYADRGIVAQHTLKFADLPSTIAADSTVQQAIQLAADSGYAVAPGALMIRTEYDEEAFTSYVVPLDSLGAPASAAPILVVIHRAGGTPLTFAYLFHIKGAEHFVAYTKNSGIRVNSEAGLIHLSGIGTPISCSEGVIWPWGCVLAKGIEAIERPINDLYQAGTSAAMFDIVPVMAAGASYQLPALPEILKNVVDNFPTTYVTVAGAGLCGIICIGEDLHVKWSWIYVFTAVDDRGPVTYLSDRVWGIPCGGGRHTFSARDNAGQTVTYNLTVSVPPVVLPGGCSSPPPPDPPLDSWGPDLFITHQEAESRGPWTPLLDPPCQLPPFEVDMPAEPYDHNPSYKIVPSEQTSLYTEIAESLAENINHTWPGFSRSVLAGQSARRPESQWHWKKLRKVYRARRNGGPIVHIIIWYDEWSYGYREPTCHEQGSGGN